MKKIIVRDRFQITIPDSIRELASWIKLNEALNIYVDKDNNIVLGPLNPQKVKREKEIKEINERLLFIREASKKYETEADSTDFIADDRETRR